MEKKVCKRKTKTFKSEKTINNVKDKNKLTLIYSPTQMQPNEISIYIQTSTRKPLLCLII